ncbi:SDR family oxidoreductase [Reinekea sp.]|jgi:NAD(P)-dependent dehydrogenase (short-subunit alcohol dehydrogenase family)|uniref:SDR family oxidoreductase n=1 Tax=Reinekea sp. TaxID=1970455 RepID=UPI00398A0815
MAVKVALITGGSRGIGAATAKRLAKDGYNIVINYRANRLAAEQITRQIENIGRQAIAIQADISNEDDVQRLFQSIDEHFGRLDVLINNAGILFTQSPVVELTAERINRVLATNVTGSFLCCIEAIKRMSTRQGHRGGNIVNVSSAASRLGAPNEYVDYAASKGAMDTLTIGLALEVAEEGIRVNSVRPGLIYTEMHADGGEPNRVDRLKNNLPLKRGGTPEEVAAAISFFVSEESAYSTGAFIEVSGGR